MDKFFFSEKNIGRQCLTLEKMLNIKDNPDTKRKLKKLLARQMKETYDKYGGKKPDGMQATDFIDLLNKKSIKDCIKICEDSRARKSGSNNSSSHDELSEMKRARDRDMYGDRNMEMPNRPKYGEMNRKSQRQPGGSAGSGTMAGGFQGFNDTGGGNFAPIPQGSGQFITATGEMGDKMFFGNLENAMYGGGDSNAKDDLERKVMERQSQYAQRGKGMMSMNSDMGGMMGGGMMGGGGGMGMGMGMGQDMFGNMMGMGMNMNQGSMGNQRPPEIDFTLVHGKHSTKGQGGASSTDYNPNITGVEGFGGMGNGGFGNMGNMGMFDMNQMNPMMMNPMMMGNQMNPMMMNPMMMGNQMNPMMMGNQMNPMMMGNQMNPMIMSNQMNQANNNQNNGELQSKFNSMLAERDKLDAMRGGSAPNKGNFNPMASPNVNYNMGNMGQMDMNQILQMQKMHDMMNNNNMNHLNFNRGVQYTNEMEAMKNLDSDQLDAHIKKMKDKIYNQMNLTNFDPWFLQSLDSKELDKLIKKISLDLSGLNNVVSDNLKKSDSILNELSHSSDVNYGQQNHPVNQMAHVIHDSQSSQSNKNVIVYDDNEKQKERSIKYHDVLIKSQDYDEPKNYSDYMIEFGNDAYKNIVSFQLIDIKVPQVGNMITAHSNKLRYIVDENETDVDVAIGSYDSYSLINALQKLLSPNFNFTVNDQGIVTITNAFNKSFDIINNGKSVLRHLGFTRVNYIGRKSYVAEELPSINRKYNIHLFVEGVLDDKPLLTYSQGDDASKLCPITVKFDKPVDTLPEIFIKFKTDPDPDSQNLVDFHEQPHELRFRIGCLN